MLGSRWHACSWTRFNGVTPCAIPVPLLGSRAKARAQRSIRKARLSTALAGGVPRRFCRAMCTMVFVWSLSEEVPIAMPAPRRMCVFHVAGHRQT